MSDSVGELSPGLSRPQSWLVLALVIALPSLSYPLGWFSRGQVAHRFEIQIPVAVLYLIGVLAVVVWHLWRCGNLDLPRTRIDRPLLAVLGIGAISVMLSSNVYFSISALVLLLANVTLLFAVAIWFDLRSARSLAWIWLAAGSIEAVYGLIQFSETGVPIATIGNRDWLAAYLVISIFISFPLLASAKTRVTGKVLGAACSVVILSALATCNSLGAWLGLGAGALLILFREVWSKNHIKALLLVGAIVVAGAGLLVFKFHKVENLWAENVRPPIWRGVLTMVRDSPLIGTGLGTFTYAYASYRPPEYHARPQATNLTDHAHNEFLEITAESGIFGLAIMLWLWGVVLARGWRGAVAGNPHHWFTLGAWGGVIALLVHGLFDINLRQPPNQSLLWLLMGLVLATTRSTSYLSGDAKPKTAEDLSVIFADEPEGGFWREKGPLITMGGSVFLIGLLAYFQVYKPVMADHYFRKALIERDQEDWKGAMENYLACLHLDPYRVIAWYRLAYICAQFPETEEQAIDYYLMVSELAPDYADVNSNLAYLYVKRDKRREAIPYLRRAIQLNPYNLTLRTVLANIFLELGLDRDLKEQVLEILGQDPDHPWANRIWEEKFKQEGGPDSARKETAPAKPPGATRSEFSTFRPRAPRATTFTVKLTAADLAKHLDAELVGNGEAEIKGISPVNQVKPGDVTFAENEKYLALAEQSQAAAIIVPLEIKTSPKTLLRTQNPKVALAKVLAVFFPAATFPAEIHASAHVGKDVKLGKDVHVGPHAIVEDGATIGDHTAIAAGAVVGLDAVIGSDCVIHSNATIYHKVRIGNRVIIHSGAVIGSDGFGYVWDGKSRLKIPQVGIVIIEDDVEIGANTAIDRGTMGATIIKRGTKIDNLVQIAHNVVIGENGIICGLVGISGSCTVGSNVTLAGQVGMADHIKIGDNVIVGAKSGVKDNIPPNSTYLGIPAVPGNVAKRQLVAQARLPELIKRVHELEVQLRELREQLKHA